MQLFHIATKSYILSQKNFIYFYLQIYKCNSQINKQELEHIYLKDRTEPWFNNEVVWLHFCYYISHLLLSYEELKVYVEWFAFLQWVFNIILWDWKLLWQLYNWEGLKEGVLL